MSLPWYKSVSGWTDHPKVGKLAVALEGLWPGAPATALAVGFMDRLRDHASRYAADGVLEGDTLSLAVILRVEHETAESLLPILLRVRVLGEREDGAWDLRGWDEVQGAHVAKVARDRARPSGQSRAKSARVPRESRAGSAKVPRGSRALEGEGDRDEDEDKDICGPAEPGPSSPAPPSTAVASGASETTPGAHGADQADHDPGQRSDALTAPPLNPSTNRSERPAWRQLADAWNPIASRLRLPQVERTPPKSVQGSANARLREGLLDRMGDLEAAIEASAWHLGQNDRDWRADFRWLVRPGKADALLEQHRARKRAPPTGAAGRGSAPATGGIDWTDPTQIPKPRW